MVRGDRAVRVPIRIGMAGADDVELTSGVSEGDEIIISDMRDYMHLAEVRIKCFSKPEEPRNSHMIQLKEIEKVYRTERIETVALADVNLTVREGEFVSIMGPSGCGKSTLLNLMGLLDEPTRGTVRDQRLAHRPLFGPRLAAMRNKEIGFVFRCSTWSATSACSTTCRFRCSIAGCRTRSGGSG